MNNNKRKIFEEYKKSYEEYKAFFKLKCTFHENVEYRRSAEEMCHLIESHRYAIEDAKIRKRIEEWLKTDEGSEWKKEREERISSLRNEIKTEQNDILKKARTIIINSLGQEWDVNMPSIQSMDVGLVENYRENGNPYFHFGCDFSITWYQNPDYDEEKFGKTFKLYLCNCSTSEFEINKNDTKVKYITGVGKFLSDEKMIEQLTEIISKFDYKFKMTKKTISDIKQELDNPPYQK